MAKKERQLPAGCRPVDSLRSGDENTEPFVAPEYKAMATKGIPLAGKITLAQYERLVRLGYDGDVVRRWTQYHAAQVLRKPSPNAGSVSRDTG